MMITLRRMKSKQTSLSKKMSGLDDFWISVCALLGFLFALTLLTLFLFPGHGHPSNSTMAITSTIPFSSLSSRLIPISTAPLAHLALFDQEYPDLLPVYKPKSSLDQLPRYTPSPHAHHYAHEQIQMVDVEEILVDMDQLFARYRVDLSRPSPLHPKVRCGTRTA